MPGRTYRSRIKRICEVKVVSLLSIFETKQSKEDPSDPDMKELERVYDLRELLKAHGITKSVIRNKSDIIDVNGTVHINMGDYDNLPFKFGIVKGDFTVMNCHNLEDLTGFPEEVHGNITITNNGRMKSLKGFETECHGTVNISMLPIKTLEGLKLHHKSYQLSISYMKQLNSLKGCPSKTGIFSLYFCPSLTSLEHCPTDISSMLVLKSLKGITSLKGLPKEINDVHIIECENLENLEHIPVHIPGELEILDCPKVVDYLSVFSIKNIENLNLIDKKLTAIIKRHYLDNRNIIECQEELIESGYSKYARLSRPTKKTETVKEDLRDDLEKKLDDLQIKNWVIRPDGLVDVDGDVRITFSSEKKIPVKFGKITGQFEISHTTITSLENSPEEVTQTFTIESNMYLTSLEGMTQKLGKSIIVGNCKLIKNLKGCPKSIPEELLIKDLDKLESLEGSPDRVHGVYGFNLKALKSLKGGPTICTDLYSIDNAPVLVSLEGMPKKIENGFISITNCPNLESLKHVSTEIKGNFNFVKCPKVKDALTIFKIKGINNIFHDNKKLEHILQKHYDNGRDVVECQEELIDVGLKEYARLK